MCRVDSDDRIAHVFHLGTFPSSDPQETILFNIKKDAREINKSTTIIVV